MQTHDTVFMGWQPGVTATREIGIDAGHRVTHHGSKCRNVHGHRYTIQCTIGGQLVARGEEQGMVMDFSFLKEEMLREIDAPCDHGLILWVRDPLVYNMFLAGNLCATPKGLITGSPVAEEWPAVVKLVEGLGGVEVVHRWFGKLYLIDDVPTAENLAKHWYGRLAPAIKRRTEGRVKLLQVRVWETPNCYADFRAPTD